MEDAVNVEVDNSQVTATPATDTNVATNVEVDNSQISTQTVDNSVDNSQVINTATPMDSNMTYNNLGPTEISPMQQAIEEAVDNTYQRDLQANSGVAMDNFLNRDYNYDKSEAGTYWVAGAINDVETQMQFLNTLITEEMYDEMDLQKYYYDTTLATARAYAAEKKKETAYGYYRAAQEKAIAEASLTGWYMPAEGTYMLGQYTVAQNVVDDPEATAEELNRAHRVINLTEKWFNANQISTRGIKCLSLLNHEETVRHNTEMGRLLGQANDIAGSSAAASAALNKLKLKAFKFDIEEEELAMGDNISKIIGLDDDDYLGHDLSDPEYAGFQALKGGYTVADIARDPNVYARLIGMRGTQWMQEALGSEKFKEYQEAQKAYDNTGKVATGNVADSDIPGMASETYETEPFYLVDPETNEQTDTKINKVYVVKFRNPDGTFTTRLYGTSNGEDFFQLNFEDIVHGTKQSHYFSQEIEKDGRKVPVYHGPKTKDGAYLGELIDMYSVTSAYDYWGGTEDELFDSSGNRIRIGNRLKSSPLTNTDGWNSQVRSQKVVDTINEYQNKGYHVLIGQYADDRGAMNGEKQGVIMYNDKEDKYISIGVSSSYGLTSWGGEGKVHEISSADIKYIPNKDWGDLSLSQKMSARNQMEFIGKYGDGTGYAVYAYKDGYGNTHYVRFNAGVETNWGGDTGKYVVDTGTDNFLLSGLAQDNRGETLTREEVVKNVLNNDTKAIDKYEQEISDYNNYYTKKPVNTNKETTAETGSANTGKYSSSTNLELGNVGTGGTRLNPGNNSFDANYYKVKYPEWYKMSKDEREKIRAKDPIDENNYEEKLASINKVEG